MDLDHDATRLSPLSDPRGTRNGSQPRSTRSGSQPRSTRDKSTTLELSDWPPEPRVAILLSSFNGERYLPEQLRSFTSQTYSNWILYWRDDGSTDTSASLIAEFGKEAGKSRCLRLPTNGKLRATGSFLALLSEALRDDTDVFAFSDQDDVWLPPKLAHAVSALMSVTAARPALYFCERTPVDSTLRPIGLSPELRRKPPSFPAALTQNIIPGCCMALNRAAAELVVTAEVPDSTWHDWWCYLVVSAWDGLLLGGSSPDILYRQHGENLIGEKIRFWHRAMAASRRGRNPFLHLFWGHVAALQAQSGRFPERTRATLDAIVSASKGGIYARARALFIPGLVRQTWLETMVFRLWFLLG